MKKITIIFGIIISIQIFSCTKNDLIPSEKNKTIENLNKSSKINSNVNLKKEFSKALAIALSESKQLRNIIKISALEMFNDDYEVLFEMIKNEKLEDGITIENFILKFISDKKVLKQLEKEFPTLTILVPQLPENSFNARVWDINSQIPKVGVAIQSSNQMAIFNNKGEEKILELQYTPGFPIIVIKENERVISESNDNFKKINSNIIQSKMGKKFRFTFNNFDKKISKKARFVSPSQIDSKLISAYNTYLNDDGWQRDEIYYDITPGQTRGQFNYDFQESIKSFTLVGDPWSEYNFIADQDGDATINGIRGGGSSHWAGGAFEFKVSYLVNAKNGTGAEFYDGFSARGEDLFNLSYIKIFNRWFGEDVYILDVNNISFKQMPLNLSLMSWDLNNYASSLKIKIEEVDLTEKKVETENTTAKFATNFAIDGPTLILKKIGLKFGASQELAQSQTFTKEYTQGNDQLGEVIVNFADNIIISKLSFVGFERYQTREYVNGKYSISVEPKRVQ